MAITKHPEGSFRELLAIALPLMLSSLSVMAMLFIDRLFLAHYSLEDMNASVNATTLSWTFHYGWIVLASITEVFVAQYNGAGEKKKIGEPVWQMIWLSLASTFMYVPLAIWGGALFYGDSDGFVLERDFFWLSMLFGPTYPLYSALVGFYVGRGKTYLVTWLAIAANVLNAALDWVLIFGWSGWLEPMGIRGAVVATNATTLLEVAILAYFFLNAKSRRKYNTGVCAINWQSMWRCLVVGGPSALFVAIELLGWSAYYAIMTLTGKDYITVAGICQSVLILLWFAVEGVSKAVTTISGNLIGAGKANLVPKVMLSGAKFHLFFFGSLILLYPFIVDGLVESFLPHLDVHSLDFLRQVLSVSLLFAVVNSFFEGIRFVFSGALTAAGDTVFLMVGGTLSIWLLMVIPMYVAMVYFGARIEVANAICLAYSIASNMIYWWRFRSGYWQTISIRTI